jgi:hypothetical protein
MRSNASESMGRSYCRGRKFDHTKSTGFSHQFIQTSGGCARSKLDRDQMAILKKSPGTHLPSEKLNLSC